MKQSKSLILSVMLVLMCISGCMKPSDVSDEDSPRIITDGVITSVPIEYILTITKMELSTQVKIHLQLVFNNHQVFDGDILYHIGNDSYKQLPRGTVEMPNDGVGQLAICIRSQGDKLAITIFGFPNRFVVAVLEGQAQDKRSSQKQDWELGSYEYRIENLPIPETGESVTFHESYQATLDEIEHRRSQPGRLSAFEKACRDGWSQAIERCSEKDLETLRFGLSFRDRNEDTE